jgi:TonB family protein
VLRLLLLLPLLLPALAAAQVEGARREEVDAGVHVPVLTKAPELLEFVQAPWPEGAADAGVTGAEVKLAVTLAADGSVAEAAVTAPAGNGFDEAAVDAVKRFRFSPAEVDGVPAPVTLEYVYRFQLQVVPEPTVSADGGVPAPPPAKLVGEVIARGSRSRVPGAVVRCGEEPEAPEAVTDDDGKFQLEVPPGPCPLRVVAQNFQPYSQDETLAPGETTEVRLYLVPRAIGFETTVRGKRDKKEVVRRTVERAELQKVPGTFGDPIRVVQNFPGVARTPFGLGQLLVRGANPNQTGTYMDGVEVPLLFHLGGGPSVINSEFLDRIDFFPGGFGARYGRAVGGIVDVATRKGASDTLHGVAKVDLLDASAFVEAPLADGVSVAAAARRSYVDLLLPAFLPKSEDGSTLLVLPRYWDYQVRVDFGRSRKDASRQGSSYYVMAFGSDDQLTLVSSSPSQPRDVTIDTRTLFHRVKGDWTYRNGRFTSVLTPFLGYDLVKTGFGAISFDADRYNAGLREDLSLEVNETVTARAGLDLIYEHTEGRAKLPFIAAAQYVGFPGAEPKVQFQELVQVFNVFDAAAYLEADFKLGPVTVTPGVRATAAHVRRKDMQSVDPRLWVRWAVRDGTAVKASAGLYAQTPDGGQLAKPPYGNPNLTFERSFQSSLGVEHKLTDVLNVDLTGFYNNRYDLVTFPGTRTVNADGSVTQLPSENRGLGRAYGLELMLRHEVTKNFFGWLAYTFSRSETRRRGGPDWALSNFDQTHILTAVGSYRLPLGFELGARFRYVTGNPRTPLEHPWDKYSADGNRFYGTNGDTNSARLPAFNQLDIRIDKNWLFDNWTLDTYLDVQNVYNAPNTEFLTPDYRYRSQVPITGIPILPVLGVKGSF